MPDIQLGQDAVVSAFFESASGPLTGLAGNFTVTVTNRANGGSVSVGSVSENPANSGNYEATLDDATLTGRMRLKVAWTNTTNELYAEYFLSIGDVPTWARTRRELRYRIATRLWGEEKVWQERATSGTTTTAVLSNLIVGGDGEFRGHYLWFGSGANRHQTRRVSDFTASTTTLTWSPALGTAITGNDLVEVYPVRPGRINDAIDDAVAELRSHVLIDADEGLYDTDGTTTEFNLPSDAVYVYNVGLTRDDDSRFLGWFEPSAWSLFPNRVLRVSDWGYSSDSPFDWSAYYSTGIPDGYKLRVQMLCDIDPPAFDDSYVDANPQAIVDLACMNLALSDPALRQLLPFYQVRAERARMLARTALPPGVREVLR